MSARQLLLLLVAAVVLGGIGWVVFNRGASSWEGQPAAGGEKVLKFPLNDVARITIDDGASELNLIKKSDTWVVGERADYPANFEQVSRFLQKLWDLKPVQTLQVGPSQFARLDLVEPAKDGKGGTLLDLKDKESTRIAALLLGKQYLRQSAQRVGPTSYPAGRYVMNEDGSKRVSLVGDALQEAALKPERWLNRDFIKIEKPKAIEIQGTPPATGWKIIRDTETAEWKFADAKPGEKVDAQKATGLVSPLANMSFTDVLAPDAKPETIGLDKATVATIQTFDGFTYTLKLGKPDKDKYPMTVAIAAQLQAERSPAPKEKPEENKRLNDEFAARKKTLEAKLAKEKKFEGRPYLMSKYSVEQLLKTRADFVASPPTPSPSPAAPLKPAGHP